MRMARLQLTGASSLSQRISRVVGGQMLLESVGKEKLVEILGKVSAACSVEFEGQSGSCGSGAGSQGLPLR